MDMKAIKRIYYNWRRRILSRVARKKLDLSDITIISMNCIGGVLYHDCKVRFLSPTVNLYFLPSDFIKFVNNLHYYLSITPHVEMGDRYPIGVLDDIRIFFMHYDTPAEALEKWESRKQRVNYERVFVIMVERDGFSRRDFEHYQRINYPKLLYTINKNYSCSESLYFNKYKHLKQLPDIIQGRHIYDKMKLINSIKKAYE